MGFILELAGAPYTYTLHPTPYTLHPAPYTLHPTLYTLHPTPYPQPLYSKSRGRWSSDTYLYECGPMGFILELAGPPYTTPFTLHPAPCTPHSAPCTLHPAPCTLHPTLNP